MANGKLVAIVTALMLTMGGQGAHAAYTRSHLEQIEQFIVNGQWDRLRAYLVTNPALLGGNDVLAAALRKFLADTNGGTIASIPVSSLPDLDTVAAARDSY